MVGKPEFPNLLHLTDNSQLCLRLPSNQVPFVYRLAGKTLNLNEYKIRLGRFNKFSGNVNPIQPSPPSVFVGKFAITSKNKESQFTKNGMKFKEFVFHKVRVTMLRIILMMM
ncbi:MAG: type I-MYXAN CRISPR-associated protein Cas6/Cmx6 [Cyanobacteria bacterium J06592_8]